MVLICTWPDCNPSWEAALLCPVPHGAGRIIAGQAQKQRNLSRAIAFRVLQAIWLGKMLD
jgi:hypothetical protein